MEGIKNVLFDMGGVLMDLNRMNCVKACEALGFKDIETYLDDFCQKGPFLKVETGEIEKEEFYSDIRKEIPAATDEEIKDAFMQFITGFPAHRLEFIRNLKYKGYRVMLLSNTNPILFPEICEKYFTQEGLTLDDYFDGIYLSYQINAAKPDPEAFRQVIKQSGVNPEETLFIDDSQKNLNTASTFGFETLLCSEPDDYFRYF